MSYRVKLVFERTAKVKEIGGISVDIEPGESIADVYTRAYQGEFAEYLPTEREYSDEKWEFKILKETDD